MKVSTKKQPFYSKYVTEYTLYLLIYLSTWNKCSYYVGLFVCVEEGRAAIITLYGKLYSLFPVCNPC